MDRAPWTCSVCGAGLPPWADVCRHEPLAVESTITPAQLDRLFEHPIKSWRPKMACLKKQGHDVVMGVSCPCPECAASC